MLETKAAREQSGRDSFSRYRAQVRSAAMAALSLLDGGEIDRIYCDLHEDFVVRVRSDNGFSYKFYQVKTKGKQNQNWTINEVMGLKSTLKLQSGQDSAKIKESFVGKLLLHTVVFNGACSSVVFQTNVNSDDNIEEILDDIAEGVFENKYTRVLLERFVECFGGGGLTESEIKERLAKLSFECDVQYLKEKNNNFEPLARGRIYEFSEIDLELVEFKEIVLRLLELVESKSSGIISEWTAENIEKYAGISIDDLLGILSISREAYYSLLEGGDPKAIKSASIIQRVLKKGGAGDKEIEYCSRCKSDWDVWIRNNRHVIQELDLEALVSKVRLVLLQVRDSSNRFNVHLLRLPIKQLVVDLQGEKLLFDLDENLLLGALFSELIKGEV